MMGDLEKVCDAFANAFAIAEAQGCEFTDSNDAFVHTHRCWVEKLAAQRKLHIEFRERGKREYICVSHGGLTVFGQ